MENNRAEMKKLADKILKSNNIDWIPLSYVYFVDKIKGNLYRISFISGGKLGLRLK